MIRHLCLLAFMLIFSIPVFSQINVFNVNATADDLVDRLVGAGVTYSNAQFIGSSPYVNGTGHSNKGYYTGGGNIIGIHAGIILSTGNAVQAYGPNSSPSMSFNNTKGGDATLNAIVAPRETYDAIGFEFDFVPESDFIEFKYVFASEEYNEYVGSNFNDVFGFFITSLETDGYAYNQKNIAIVPGTANTAVAINNINNGYRAEGQMGTGPCTNCAYFRDNATGNFNVEYDGFTTVLTASANVVPCKTYRMKIVIADVSDALFDSAVFLEQNSFTSPVLENVEVTYSNPMAGSNNSAVEGCSNAKYLLLLSAPTPMNRNIPFSLSGTADFGVDYYTIPDISSSYNTFFPNQYFVTIPTGSSQFELTIVPVDDALVEGTETVILTMQSNVCGAPVYVSDTLLILDNTLPFSGLINPPTINVCKGDNADLSFVNTAGQPVFTYLWSTNETTQSIQVSPTNTSNYHVTVTDACGATFVASSTVDVYEVPTGTGLPSNQTICSGQTTSISLTTGIAGSTFEWTVNAPATISGHAPGSDVAIAQTLVNSGSAAEVVTYTVTPFAGGCRGDDFTVTVTVQPLPIIYNISGGGPFCPNTSGVSVNIDGSQIGINYNIYVDGNIVNSFAGNGSAQTIDNINVVGNLTIVAVDATTGCTVNMNGNLTVYNYNLPAFASITVNKVESCISPDGSIVVVGTGGQPPYEYSLNGGVPSTNNTFTLLDVGFYTVRLFDANGCFIDSTNIQMSSTTGPSINDVLVVNNICPGESNGQITISVDESVVYSIDNGQNYQTDSVFTGLPSGTYFIVVKDAGNCEDAYLAVVGGPQAFNATHTVTNAVCGTPGSASITVTGGTSPYNYQWSHAPAHNSPNATGLDVGNYQISVTDGNSCLFVYNLTVGANPGVGQANVIASSNVSCKDAANGSITVELENATAPVSYNWSHSSTVNSQTVSGLSGGLYVVTITDAHNCTATIAHFISEPSNINLNSTVQNILCFGANEGYIRLNPNGGTLPYTYLWNTADTASKIESLPVGTYFVTLTDANGCVKIQEFILNSPDDIIINPIIINPICFGDNKGKVYLEVNGGVPQYNYLWSNGAVTDSIVGLYADNYTVTITDANQCTLIETYTLVNPILMTADITVDELSASISINNGNPPYTYFWSSGHTTSSVQDLAAGNYTVTVTDALGCKIFPSLTIDVPLIVPNVITPNNDGFNDDFEITNIQAYSDISIEIYNRWGDIIFQYKGTGAAYLDPANRWDGTYKGRDLPFGSYMYIIKLGDGKDHITGSVLIKR